MCDAPQNEKMRSLKVRRYVVRLIDLNEYLDYLPGATLYDKIDVTELNEIILNVMPNSWYKQAYVVARNDFFSIHGRYYGLKREILDYWGKLIFCLLSCCILSMY